MEDQKRFRNKRLNKDDHKDIEQAAKNTKGALGVAAVMAPVALYLKKNGIGSLKKIPSLAAKIFFKG